MERNVIRPFIDKETNKPYKEGDSFSGDEKRVAFLVDEGFLNGPKPKKRSPKNTSEDK